MNVLVTGSAGFAGKNIVENLKNIRDGKNRTRPNLSIDEIYEYDKENTPEELFFRYAEETGATVYVYRYPNLVGKFVSPNYNSAVGTFCNNIANALPITVNDPGVELEVLFIDDLMDELWDTMEGKAHHCEYPAAGEVIDGVTYDGLTPRETPDGRYCFAPVTYKAKLGEIAALLHKFRDEGTFVPNLVPGSFEKKLYSMYLSYLPKERTITELKMNVDDRGSFTELIHTQSAGQVSINITKPGITKGMHWHNQKLERFIVVSGKGLIRERRIDSDEIEEYEVSGEKIVSVVQKPGRLRRGSISFCLLTVRKISILRPTSPHCSQRLIKWRRSTICRSYTPAIRGAEKDWKAVVLNWIPASSRMNLWDSNSIPAVCIRTSTERPEALDKGCFVLSGIDTAGLLQSVDLAVEMVKYGDFGIPVPDYTDINVSDKVVRIIQSCVGVVNKMVWRKS